MKGLHSGKAQVGRSVKVRHGITPFFLLEEILPAFSWGPILIPQPYKVPLLGQIGTKEERHLEGLSIGLWPRNPGWDMYCRDGANILYLGIWRSKAVVSQSSLYYPKRGPLELLAKGMLTIPNPIGSDSQLSMIQPELDQLAIVLRWNQDELRD